MEAEVKSLSKQVKDLKADKAKAALEKSNIVNSALRTMGGSKLGTAPNSIEDSESRSILADFRTRGTRGGVISRKVGMNSRFMDSSFLEENEQQK